MARARKGHIRCMRARLEFLSRLVFSTNIVCPYMEYTAPKCHGDPILFKMGTQWGPNFE